MAALYTTVFLGEEKKTGKIRMLVCEIKTKWLSARLTHMKMY